MEVVLTRVGNFDIGVSGWMSCSCQGNISLFMTISNDPRCIYELLCVAVLSCILHDKCHPIGRELECPRPPKLESNRSGEHGNLPVEVFPISYGVPTI